MTHAPLAGWPPHARDLGRRRCSRRLRQQQPRPARRPRPPRRRGAAHRGTALVACLRKHGVTVPARAAGPRAAARLGGAPAGGGAPPARRQAAVPEHRAPSSRLPSRPAARAPRLGARRRLRPLGGHQVRDLRPPARLFPAQAKLLRERLGVPGQRSVQHEVQVGQQRLPEPAAAVRSTRGAPRRLVGLPGLAACGLPPS